MSELQKPNVLVIDQVTDGSKALDTLLTQHGFDVTLSGRAMAAFKESDQLYDLIIIKRDSTEVDFFTFLSNLRRTNGRSRCIALSDEGDLIDRVLALELGADDYIPTTTDRREILARARVVLRRPPRSSSHPALSNNGESENLAPTSGLKFERVQRCLRQSDGVTVSLTTAEFNLLTSFADHVNVPLTRERLYELVYHRRWSAYDRTLDTLVAKLRRKIERDPQHPELIKTVHGTGYIFTGLNFS